MNFSHNMREKMKTKSIWKSLINQRIKEVYFKKVSFIS